MRSASPILRPDCLVIFHENLIGHHAPATEGSHRGLVVIVNSKISPERILFPEGFQAATIASVDALGISLRHKAGINAVLLGALLRFSPEIRPEALKKAFSEFFSQLSAEAIGRNLSAFEEGYRKVRSYRYASEQSRLPAATLALPKLGYENAPLGGVIANPGNSILKDMSHSRKGTIPFLDYERCIQCGYCDMVCPDYCFVWQRSVMEGTTATLPSGTYAVEERSITVPVLQGIDYRYCKGCQKCVQACPVGALGLAADTEANRKRCQADRFEVRTTEKSFPIFFEEKEVNDES